MSSKPVRATSGSRPGKRRRMEGHSAPHSTIPLLNDDVLLEIFEWYITCRPEYRYVRGKARSVFVLRELIHTCRRWRHLILRSAERFNVGLYCTYGTPVTDLLTRYPSLPIHLEYRALEDETLTPEDIEGILRAIREQSHRLQYVDINAPGHHVQQILAAMDSYFPFLWHLYIMPHGRDNQLPKSANRPGAFILPPAFAAPRLTHLKLNEPRLLAEPKIFPHLPAIRELTLWNIPSVALLPPELLIDLLSTTPLLRGLDISFQFPGLPYRGIGTTPWHAPIKSTLGLPHLFSFYFHGAHEYFDDLASRISVLSLKYFSTTFFNRLPIPPGNSESLSYRFWKPLVVDCRSVMVDFTQDSVKATSRYEGGSMTERGVHWTWKLNSSQFDWQVASAAEFFQSLAPELLQVNSLMLYFGFERKPPEWLDVSEPEDWCDILRSFSNVKTLKVYWELRHDVSRSLMSNGVEASLDILPELRTIELAKRDFDASLNLLSEPPILGLGGDDDGGSGEEVFAHFIEARKGINRPVSIICRSRF
ncbi:hypothetical protein BC834DRAFT_847509 [Gloeopeniophorella convolvens]|nr:hypothetical protein BC834DRAFT_847509 [Gloeopeniophorella convolvens]